MNKPFLAFLNSGVILSFFSNVTVRLVPVVGVVGAGVLFFAVVFGVRLGVFGVPATLARRCRFGFFAEVVTIPSKTKAVVSLPVLSLSPDASLSGRSRMALFLFGTSTPLCSVSNLW